LTQAWRANEVERPIVATALSQGAPNWADRRRPDVNDVPSQPPTRKRKRAALTVGLLAAGVAAGAIGATAIGASAESTSGSQSAVATSSSSPGTPMQPPNGARGSAPVRSDEKSVSASTAATLKAAALKAVPGGTVYRIETDAGDAAYEAHMTKADGSLVTVKFDKNLKVIKVEAGMGEGDPAPSGQPPAGH
jgi:uncharacterized membrane protein YkoI